VAGLILAARRPVWAVQRGNHAANNERKTMNAKTLEAIRKHGEALLAAFPNATEKDPVALCKKLRRIETATHRVMTDYCNGDCDEDEADKTSTRALDRVWKLLQEPDDKRMYVCFTNRDPRGYALKLGDEWTRRWNQTRYETRQPAITTDMGGYGLLAPDLTQEDA
jgi:hypothetical protein